MADHRGQFNVVPFTQQGTISGPQTDYLLGVIKQPSDYRFKQIFVGVDAQAFNGTSFLNAYLRFFRGQVFQAPGTGTTTISGFGLKVGEIPVAKGQPLPSTTLYPYTRMLHVSNVALPLGPFYMTSDGSNGLATIGTSFDVEIECDFITLSVSWSAQQWAPFSFLAVRGFTHPIKLYHENNFEYYL